MDYSTAGGVARKPGVGIVRVSLWNPRFIAGLLAWARPVAVGEAELAASAVRSRSCGSVSRLQFAAEPAFHHRSRVSTPSLRFTAEPAVDRRACGP
ncbi:hypothetical protein G7068_10545 [Leucobacter viscericola]|uniref:Uncharacterized protein n=1 Tax=Leucobacter viscericola TaxID=2714935 RepID=A0A6G7XG57_9MICO|nr:hypothetical protein [Leucobacter viscericola]QIK63584.1 hypothetical protein G7068_10545 [Leucobacter viscericola]